MNTAPCKTAGNKRAKNLPFIFIPFEIQLKSLLQLGPAQSSSRILRHCLQKYRFKAIRDTNITQILVISSPLRTQLAQFYQMALHRRK